MAFEWYLLVFRTWVYVPEQENIVIGTMLTRDSGHADDERYRQTDGHILGPYWQRIAMQNGQLSLEICDITSSFGCFEFLTNQSRQVFHGCYSCCSCSCCSCRIERRELPRCALISMGLSFSQIVLRLSESPDRTNLSAEFGKSQT